MIRIADSVVLVDIGRSKLAVCVSLNSFPGRHQLVLDLLLEKRPCQSANPFGFLLTSIVSNLDTCACAPLTIPKYAKINSPEAGQWDSFNNWRREYGNQQQGEGCEQQHRQRCRRSQHREGRYLAAPKQLWMPASSRRGLFVKPIIAQCARADCARSSECGLASMG